MVRHANATACLDATSWVPANREYFRGGGFSSKFLTKAGMPCTMARLNLVKGLGPVLQIAEGWTVELDPEAHKILDDRTDKGWPTTWFAPRLTDNDNFKDVYSVMNNWGANHGAICCGHVGADLITLCSMLRIPVAMHNVEDKDIFRPAAWGAFGMEKEGADYRACRAYIARRFGYKKGILVGLSLFALGAFWFIPAVNINTFWAFLLGLLILFCGLTCLEAVANPYVTVLGPAKTAASRINLAQTFNALGWILGPLLGSLLIFKNDSERSIVELFADAVVKIFSGISTEVQQVVTAAGEAAVDNSSLIPPYVGLGSVVLLVLILFFFTKLPEVNADSDVSADGSLGASTPLIKQKHFVLAVVAQFLYVAAQTGIGSFFINYSVEVNDIQLTEMQAGFVLGLGGMGLFAVGRFSGSIIMRKANPGLLLGVFASLNMLFMLLAMMHHDRFGIISLLLSYLFMSIMFPSIFALGLKGLGEKTKTASSILVITVAGGAIAPMLMGFIGEKNMSIGFIVPMLCFAFIAFYGFWSIVRKR